MADSKEETVTWVVVAKKWSSGGYRNYDDVMTYVEKLRELGDPEYIPTHLLRIDEVRSRTETIIALVEPAGISADDLMPIIRERLLKLGGVPPQGEDALHWAIAQTLEAVKETSA